MESNRSTSTGRGRRARGRASSSSRLGGNSASTSSTSLLNLRRASTSRGSGSLGAGRTGEVTGAGVLVLLLVVLVQGEGELVLDLAHAVRTVLAGGRVGAHTTAVSVAADCAEQAGQLGGSEAGRGDTGGLLVDALAQVSVGSRGHGRGLGLPAASHGRAALQDGVGRGVGGLVGTGGVDAGDFAGVVLEVRHGAHAGGVDNGNQTCRIN